MTNHESDFEVTKGHTKHEGFEYVNKLPENYKHVVFDYVLSIRLHDRPRQLRLSWKTTRTYALLFFAAAAAIAPALSHGRFGRSVTGLSRFSTRS